MLDHGVTKMSKAIRGETVLAKKRRLRLTKKSLQLNNQMQ